MAVKVANLDRRARVAEVWHAGCNLLAPEGGTSKKQSRAAEVTEEPNFATHSQASAPLREERLPQVTLQAASKAA